MVESGVIPSRPRAAVIGWLDDIHAEWVTDGERGRWVALSDLNGRSARSPARDRNEVYVTRGVVV